MSNRPHFPMIQLSLPLPSTLEFVQGYLEFDQEEGCSWERHESQPAGQASTVSCLGWIRQS